MATRKKCRSGYVRNRKTNRCRKIKKSKSKRKSKRKSKSKSKRKSKRKSKSSKSKRISKRKSKSSKSGGLTRWFDEKWIDVCTGKPCGRKKYSRKGMPYCRPSRRITKNTPKTKSELSNKKIKEMCHKKRKNPTKRMKRA